MKQSSFTEMAKRNFFEMMKDVATSIPGHIIAFDVETQLAQVQIGIVRKDVNGNEFTPSPIIQVPVYFSGGQYCLEYQIDPNDEGVILFSQRCIDGWMNNGGVANNPIMRFHDMSDAMFLPGLRSQPNKLSNFENNGIRLRNEDATQYVWLKNDKSMEMSNGAGTFAMGANGDVMINDVLIRPGGLLYGTSINAYTTLTVAGRDQLLHTHTSGTLVAAGVPVTGVTGVQP